MEFWNHYIVHQKLTICGLTGIKVKTYEKKNENKQMDVRS